MLSLRGRLAFLATVGLAIAALAGAAGGGNASAAGPHDDAAPAGTLGAAHKSPRHVTVMTRNLYLGTPLQPIFIAPSLPALFGAVAAGRSTSASTSSSRVD
jgi:hypothetical protein